MHKIKLKFTKEEISNFINEGEFMSANVELHKNSIALLHKIIHLRYFDFKDIPKKLNRDEAILGGNIIRLTKLNTSLLQNVCENKLEICFILCRCIYETQINILYFLKNGEVNIFKNYVKNSLITEKEFYNNIEENIRNRNGEELPIEKSMKESISNSFDISDFEIEELNRSSSWKNLKKRLDKINVTNNLSQTYNIFYGLSSHSIHGNWQDLVQHHISQDGEFFTLNYEWNSPKPNLLYAVIIFNLIISREFAYKELEVNSKEDVRHDIEILSNYHDFLVLKYDEFRKF